MANNIGHQLRKVRTELGYSQEYMALKLKMAQSNYSLIESNQDALTLGKLNKIAEVLNKNPLDLIQINGNAIADNEDARFSNAIFVQNTDKELLAKLSLALERFIQVMDKK